MTDPANQPSQDVPFIYASGVAGAATGTDFKLVFTNARPRPSAADAAMVGEMPTEWAAVVTMSFHMVKDLHAVLGDAVSALESRFGELDTPYLQDRRNREAD